MFFKIPKLLLPCLLLATVLAACHKAEVPSVAADLLPSVTGNSIKFAANSPITQRLITSPVVSAQQNVLKLPGRIVWDEDHTARISSPVAGHLTSVLVQTGSLVKAGQPLAYLSSPDIGSAQADAEKAKTDLAQAARIHSRDKELADAGIIAGKDLEQAQSDLTKNRVEAARTQMRLKSLGGSNAVDQRYTIKSPIAGILVERTTNPGMEYRPDQAIPSLFVVTNPSYLWCWIDAPEETINAFKKGMKLTMSTNVFPNKTFDATVDFIADSLDPISRSLKVRAKLINSENLLKAEMFVNVMLATDLANTLDIPAKAVFLKNGMQMIFIKTKDNIYLRKTIQPIASNEQWVSVADGLNKGDEVVLDGSLYLEKILEDAAPQAASLTLSANKATY